jgi:hypothetical protein
MIESILITREEHTGYEDNSFFPLFPPSHAYTHCVDANRRGEGGNKTILDKYHVVTSVSSANYRVYGTIAGEISVIVNGGKLILVVAAIEFLGKHQQSPPVVVGSIVKYEDEEYVVFSGFVAMSNHTYEAALVKVMDLDARVGQIEDTGCGLAPDVHFIKVSDVKVTEGIRDHVDLKLVSMVIQEKCGNIGRDACVETWTHQRLQEARKKSSGSPKTTPRSDHHSMGRDNAFSVPEGYKLVQVAKMEQLEIENEQLRDQVAELEGARKSKPDDHREFSKKVDRLTKDFDHKTQAMTAEIDALRGAVLGLENVIKAMGTTLTDAVQEMRAVQRSQPTHMAAVSQYVPFPVPPSPATPPPYGYATLQPHGHGFGCQCKPCLCRNHHGPGCQCTGQVLK